MSVPPEHPGEEGSIEATIAFHEEFLESRSRKTITAGVEAVGERMNQVEQLIIELGVLMANPATTNPYQTNLHMTMIRTGLAALRQAADRLMAAGNETITNVEFAMASAVVHHLTKGPPSTARLLPDQYEPTAPAFDGSNPALPADPPGVIMPGLVPGTVPVSATQPVINTRI